MNNVPLAQREIETAQALGEVIRLHVIVNSNQGIPDSFPELSIIPIDVLPNRPLNLEFDEDSMSIDLCFMGPPQRCRFRWDDIVAVSQKSEGKEYLKPCQTTISYVFYVDKNENILLKEISDPTMLIQVKSQSQISETPTRKTKPQLRIVK